MYPHERSLVQRLANQPFALIGINSDPKEKVKSAMERENISWRSFWDGGSTGGPIARSWGVRSWPTIYVVDDRGIIRHKNVRGEAMDEAVDELLKRAIVTLVEDVKSDDPKTRGLAAFRMGQYNAPDALNLITPLLKDESELVQQRAATGLALLGEAVDPLLPMVRKAVTDDEAEVRVASLDMLGKAKDQQSVTLVSEALDDDSVNVRRAAVATLGKLGDPSSVPALTKAAEDEDLTTAKAAVYALADLGVAEGVQALQTLASQDQHPSRVWIAVALHRVGQEGTEPRFKALLKDDDAKVRQYAVTSLAELADFDATELLILALDDDEAPITKTASSLLASNDSPRAKDALKKYLTKRVQLVVAGLSDSDRRKQQAARTELDQLGPEAAPLLLTSLDDDLPNLTRMYIARAIGMSGNTAVIQPVVETLMNADLDAAKRSNYENVLRGMLSAAREQVDQLAKHPDGAVRISGIRLLMGQSDPAARELLKEAISDDDKMIRATAAYAMSMQKDEDAFEVLLKLAKDADPQQMQLVINGLANYDPKDSIPAIVQLLEKADEQVATSAISVLARFPTKESTEAIVKAAQKHPGMRIQSIAISSLGRQRTDEAVKALAVFLENPDVNIQRMARSALLATRNAEARKIVAEYDEKKKKDE